MTKWQLATSRLAAKASPRDMAWFRDEKTNVNREFEGWAATHARGGNQIHNGPACYPPDKNHQRTNLNEHVGNRGHSVSTEPPPPPRQTFYWNVSVHASGFHKHETCVLLWERRGAHGRLCRVADLRLSNPLQEVQLEGSAGGEGCPLIRRITVFHRRVCLHTWMI